MRHIESDLQIACVRWFDYQYPHLSRLLYHPANGGRRSKREAARLKAEGVRAGVADLCLAVKSGPYGALYVELKAPTGRSSDSQKSWRPEAEAHGNYYAICRSVDEFVEIINWYLNL